MSEIVFPQSNAVLIQNCSVSDLEKIVNRAVSERIKAFYDTIREKPPVLIRRKVAAERLGVSLPTIDLYAKNGFLHPKRLGGRVFFEESEIEKYKKNNNL